MNKSIGIPCLFKKVLVIVGLCVKLGSKGTQTQHKNSGRNVYSDYNSPPLWDGGAGAADRGICSARLGWQKGHRFENCATESSHEVEGGHPPLWGSYMLHRSFISNLYSYTEQTNQKVFSKNVCFYGRWW